MKSKYDNKMIEPGVFMKNVHSDLFCAFFNPPLS